MTFRNALLSAGLTAALFYTITTATAWDADPASFRADPQAWVRKVLIPGCSKPTDAKDAAACDCMVPLLAAKITKADVLRVNDPDFAKGFGKIAIGASLLCLPRH
jgi:hypothetical protein